MSSMLLSSSWVFELPITCTLNLRLSGLSGEMRSVKIRMHLSLSHELAAAIFFFINVKCILLPINLTPVMVHFFTQSQIRLTPRFNQAVNCSFVLIIGEILQLVIDKPFQKGFNALIHKVSSELCCLCRHRHI